MRCCSGADSTVVPQHANRINEKRKGESYEFFTFEHSGGGAFIMLERVIFKDSCVLQTPNRQTGKYTGGA